MEMSRRAVRVRVRCRGRVEERRVVSAFVRPGDVVQFAGEQGIWLVEEVQRTEEGPWEST